MNRTRLDKHATKPTLRMPDLCPFRSNSKASRNIMFSVPEDRYFVESTDAGKINHTLQALWATMVEDLNKLSDEGILHSSTGESSILSNCVVLYRV